MRRDYELDPKILKDCVDALLAAAEWIARPKSIQGPRDTFDEPSMDHILETSGVRWSVDRHLYQAYEREARHRAMATLGRVSAA